MKPQAKPADNGTVTCVRPGQTQEQRIVRLRYGGLALVAALATVAAVVCEFWGFHDSGSYAALAMTIAFLSEGSQATRFQADLKWVTGYDRAPRRPYKSKKEAGK